MIHDRQFNKQKPEWLKLYENENKEVLDLRQRNMKDSKVLGIIPSNKKNTDFKFDWRDENVISDVKAQKQCGGCYAFTAAATIEGAYNIMMK